MLTHPLGSVVRRLMRVVAVFVCCLALQIADLGGSAKCVDGSPRMWLPPNHATEHLCRRRPLQADSTRHAPLELTSLPVGCLSLVVPTTQHNNELLLEPRGVGVCPLGGIGVLVCSHPEDSPVVFGIIPHIVRIMQQDGERTTLSVLAQTAAIGRRRPRRE